MADTNHYIRLTKGSSEREILINILDERLIQWRTKYDISLEHTKISVYNFIKHGSYKIIKVNGHPNVRQLIIVGNNDKTLHVFDLTMHIEQENDEVNMLHSYISRLKRPSHETNLIIDDSD
jgi:hypothetical protein